MLVCIYNFRNTILKLVMASCSNEDRDDEIWDSMSVAHSEYWMQEDSRVVNKRLTTSQVSVLTQEQAAKQLRTAGENGDADSLRLILSEFPQAMNSPDSDGYTALHRAAYNGHTEAIQLLLSVGADVSARTMDGWQAIHCACKWNKTSAVEVLLQEGADPNSQTNGGLTPLHMAASNNLSRDVLVILLMHSSIDTTLVSSSGDVAEQVALRYGGLGYLFEVKDKCLDFTFNESCK